MWAIWVSWRMWSSVISWSFLPASESKCSCQTSDVCLSFSLLIAWCQQHVSLRVKCRLRLIIRVHEKWVLKVFDLLEKWRVGANTGSGMVLSYWKWLHHNPNNRAVHPDVATLAQLLVSQLCADSLCSTLNELEVRECNLWVVCWFTARSLGFSYQQSFYIQTFSLSILAFWI